MNEIKENDFDLIFIAADKKNDKFTLNMREFNEFISNDKRVEQIIIPLGDGMTICRVL